jgi:membrane protein DedA with SNARE-associated domain
MSAAVADTVEGLIEEFGYVGLIVVMALEHVFPPIPSELVLPLAGFQIASGELSFAGALAASTAGSLIGASALYAIARRGGRPAILRFRTALRIDATDLARAEQRFRRHTAWMVVLGRMVPGLRSAVSLPPGLLRMPFGRYLALTLAGSLAWNAALLFAGQQLGSRWSEVGHALGPVARWTLVAVVPLALVGLWVRRRRRNDRASDGDES